MAGWQWALTGPQKLAKELAVDAEEVFKALHVVSGFFDKAIELLAHKNVDSARAGACRHF